MVYRLESEVIVWSTEQAAWHFAVVDEQTSKKIHTKHDEKKRGFGSHKVNVTVGSTTWQTSIFPDKRSGTFLLPVKASVRKKEDIYAGDTIRYRLEILE